MRKFKLPTDKELKHIEQEVDTLLKEWDITYCYMCGKEMSILDGRLHVDSFGEHWIHKNRSQCG